MNGLIHTIKGKAKVNQTCLLFLGIVWVFSVGFGFSKLYNYEYKAGHLDQVSTQWPAKVGIHPPKDLYRLVMMAHPQCPCTRASLGELALIMAQSQGKVQAYVLFIKPKGFDDQWAKADLFKTAANIPGVEVIIDDEGKRAQVFGGTTSGETLLYNSKGQLVFTGGITASRGHSGDNVGRSTIVALIHDQPVNVHSTPTFGCSLKDEEAELSVQKKEGGHV